MIKKIKPILFAVICASLILCFYILIKNSWYVGPLLGLVLLVGISIMLGRLMKKETKEVEMGNKEKELPEEWVNEEEKFKTDSKNKIKEEKMAEDEEEKSEESEEKGE